MMQFAERPQEGMQNYATKASRHAAALSELTAEDGTADYAAISQYIAERRNQIWGDVKPYFMAAQHRKCGFCEVIITESTGDVEHFRPKNAVWSLAEPGEEQESLVNLRGRKFNKDFASGYWWLAYNWGNYLVSCPTCNQKWKSALFPIAEQRLSAPTIGDEESETALLIDPFGNESPVLHLAFDELGQVQAFQNSHLGRATILTCGLDRESLRSSRYEKALRAFAMLKKLAKVSSAEEIIEILRDFYLLGRAEFVHSGMIRCIFQQNTRMSWDALQTTVEDSA
jgi:hypothetical protein